MVTAFIDRWSYRSSLTGIGPADKVQIDARIQDRFWTACSCFRHDGDVPLHRQIETSIREAIRAGRLPRGSTLPPSRALAADLGVSRGVVVEAYQQLTAEGYLASRSGGYTRVAAGPAPAVAPLQLAAPQPLRDRPQLRPR